MGKLWLFIKNMIKQFFKNSVGRTGAELAYFMLFTIFPVLICFNGVIGSLNINIESVSKAVTSVFPASISGLIMSYISYISEVNTTPFYITGIVLTIYSLYRVVNAIFYAINKNYVQSIDIKYYAKRRMLIAVFFAISLIITLALLTLVVATGNNFMAWIVKLTRLPMSFAKLWRVLRFVLLAAMLFFTLLVAYWLAPYERIRLRQAIPGTIFTVLLLTFFTVAFSFYVDNISNYPLIYGSLGAVMLLMLWLYLLGVIIVLGGEVNYVINFVLKNKTANESTEESM